MFARYLVSTRQKNNARFASGLNKEARDIFVLERESGFPPRRVVIIIILFLSLFHAERAGAPGSRKSVTKVDTVLSTTTQQLKREAVRK
eukprot:scaffold14699_cov170-Amphora_coffeaeformis.AAC.2